ncbi:MAG: RpiB/LacA/LacB family sugar-phosphate isomerase [Planctomycetes bacterium]|nr:RpiB/LacA/LacB family sugar-phosphate isomerase [Planctomycetota bacterium]
MGSIVDQDLVEQIVSNVLAQLQPASSRPAPTHHVAVTPVFTAPAPGAAAVTVLTAPIITAELLSTTVRLGQPLRVGQQSILTPSAQDWLNTKKISWSRGAESTSVSTSTNYSAARWQLIVQTVTPNVKALQDALKRQPEGWQLDLVGQPLEAATQAASMISTAERDGVVVLSEYAEIIACRANRNERVRAAVISDRKQLEQTRQHLGVNLVCINPNGRTFIELRNLLRDCAGAKPAAPAGWKG